MSAETGVGEGRVRVRDRSRPRPVCTRYRCRPRPLWARDVSASASAFVVQRVCEDSGAKENVWTGPVLDRNGVVHRRYSFALALQVEETYREQLLKLDDTSTKSKATRLYGNEIAIAILSDELYEKWMAVLRAVKKGDAVGVRKPKEGVAVDLKRWHYRTLSTQPDAVLHLVFDKILGSQTQRDDFYQSVLRVCKSGRGESRHAQVWDDPPVDWFRTLRRYIDCHAGVAAYDYFLSALDIEVQECCGDKADLDVWHRQLTTVLGFDRVSPPLDSFYTSSLRAAFVKGLHAPLTSEAQNIRERWRQLPAPFTKGTAEDRYAKLCASRRPDLKRKGDWWPPFVASDYAMNVYDASKVVVKATAKRKQKVATPESDAAGNKFFVVVSPLSPPAVTWKNVLAARNSFISSCLEGGLSAGPPPVTDIMLNTEGRVVRREHAGSLLLTGAGSSYELMTPTEKKLLLPFYIAVREQVASRADVRLPLKTVVRRAAKASEAVYVLARHIHGVRKLSRGPPAPFGSSCRPFPAETCLPRRPVSGETDPSHVQVSGEMACVPKLVRTIHQRCALHRFAMMPLSFGSRRTTGPAWKRPGSSHGRATRNSYKACRTCVARL